MELAADEKGLLDAFREVKLYGHGRLMVEVRDGRGQMIEATKKTKLN